MHSDFSSAGRSARASLPIPDFAIESVRTRARAGDARDRVRALALCATLALAVISVGSGLAAHLLDGVRTWLSGNTASVVVKSLVVVHEPMPADVRAVAARASFPVVFPVGFDSGARVAQLMYAPRERPDVITVLYRNPRTKRRVGFTLSDTSALNAGSASPGSSLVSKVVHWNVGRETVIVVQNSIAPSAVEKAHQAMLGVTPEQSVAAAASTARRIIVIGGSPLVADAAERYAPAAGSSVLIDPLSLRTVARLVRSGKPLLDTRIAFLTDIPSEHGAPQYMKATVHWPRVAVVSAGGLRAVDAVLRRTGGARGCACSILVHERNAATFWIWEIRSATAPATRYVVDANRLTIGR